MTGFRAGAACLSLGPPLGLPMIGFVRQPHGAWATACRSRSARRVERGGTRVLLCGVDVVGISGPQIGPLVDRVAAATGRARGGAPQRSHTHLARRAAPGEIRGDEADGRASIDASPG